MRGPIPLSREANEAAGNPGKRSQPRRGALTLGKPKPPKDLTGEAVAEWNRLIPELEEAGLLAKVDRAGLSEMCRAWGEIQEARAILGKDGWMLRQPIQNAKGEVLGEKVQRHPAALMLSDATRRWMVLAMQYGLTPVARMRMRLEASVDQSEEDDLLKLLNE
ncbi:phage terminase small subunit P27 family [Zavarzinella formosa]|uniref:phage terminase small subunit P27 family n=1 Tax=Zavarzinella formosa TaxID=360055 RepID=UPI00031D7602|nr:phage terminase small subunit P27 family [Zavarzinella formosa]